MSFWPIKGTDDPRPPLRCGYERLAPVMPDTTFVAAGAPAELRLDATKDQIIPEYPC